MAVVIFVGKGQTSSGTGAATGTLTFNDGTLDVNTLEAGYQNSAAAAAVVTGTVNVKNTAQLLVNSTLRLARYTGGGTLPVGTLNIFDGTVAGDGDIVAGGGTSTIAISNGVLAVTGVVGTPAAPIGKVALTNATLQFSVDTVTTNLVATTLTTGGSSNVINILSLPSVSVPTQVTLVEYTNAIGGAGFNFVLGSLVSGGGFSGYLSNNVANSSVDLAFVSLPAAPPGFRTVKLSGTNFIASGTNGVPGWPYFILVSTNVALPLNQWTSMATNQFDAGGNFTFTNSVSPGPPQKFYLLKLPQSQDETINFTFLIRQRNRDCA